MVQDWKIEKLIFLVQTDTTAGFLSKDGELLAKRKKRNPKKKFLQVTSSLKYAKSIGRVPKERRRYFRYSKKRSFIFRNGLSVRVVKEGEHFHFLNRYGAFFSSSANLSGEKFQKDLAIRLADIVVEDSRGLFEAQPSQIVKVGKKRIKRLR